MQAVWKHRGTVRQHRTAVFSDGLSNGRRM